MTEQPKLETEKICEHCGKKAEVYDHYCGLFYCCECMPEETMYNEVYFVYLVQLEDENRQIRYRVEQEGKTPELLALHKINIAHLKIFLDLGDD